MKNNYFLFNLSDLGMFDMFFSRIELRKDNKQYVGHYPKKIDMYTDFISCW